MKGKHWHNETSPVDWYRAGVYSSIFLLLSLFWGLVGYLVWWVW